MTPPKPHQWHSQVRSYELDAQGIVNNANYFHYLDHARVLFFATKGIDWKKWHDDGFDFVLIHADIQFKAPLFMFDEFYVETSIALSGFLKMVFHQTLYKKGSNKPIALGISTVVCINQKTKKPVFMDELKSLLFENKNRGAPQ